MSPLFRLYNKINRRKNDKKTTKRVGLGLKFNPKTQNPTLTNNF